MTRKDYVLIAAALKTARVSANRPGPKELGRAAAYQTAIDEVAYNLGSALAATNPRFDRERFLKACGVQS